MSSQGKNAAEYRAINLTGPTGSTGGSILSVIPTQFSSDSTKIRKELSFYRQYTHPGVSAIPPDLSNQSTKTYQFGYIICTGCTGAFPNNVIPNIPTGN